MNFVNVISGDTMDDIYVELSKKLLDEGDRVGNTLELQNVSLHLTNPLKSFVTVRDTSKAYALGEIAWYGAHSNSMEFISSYGSMWERLSDDGKTSNSAYGYIINRKHWFNQVDQVIEQLTVDPLSRRAKININVPNKRSITTKDEPCTLTLQFLLRDGKLNMTTMMRSNDIWFGLPYDVLYFTTLQHYIASTMGVELGTYHHFVTSMHLYTRNIDDIKEAVNKQPIEYSLNNLIFLLMSTIPFKKLSKIEHSQRSASTVGILKSYGIEIETEDK